MFFMQLVDYPPISSIAVMNAAPRSISGLNQKTYARLKMSLRLHLRRQIFLAVCDDLELRNLLVNQLQSELSPYFVSLNLKLADPNPMAQVSQWFSQWERQSTTDRSPVTGVQILGIEHLTRQPAPVQKRFLTHLQAIEYYMPVLEYTMLLWVTRPWLRSIQQSAPTFWDWHTALFEFEGDPTPLRPVRDGRSSQTQSFASPASPPLQSVPLAEVTSCIGDEADVSDELEEAMLFQQLDRFPETIWQILTEDLARLDRPPSDPLTSATKVISEEVLAQPTAPIPNQPPASIAATILPASALQQAFLAALEQNPDSEQHQAGWESLQRIEQLQVQQVPENVLASAYYSLGQAYRECIEQGDSSPHTLTIAIAAHEQTLTVLPKNAEMGADVANDLGNLYWMRSRYATKADQQLTNLEQAIQAYQLALTRVKPDISPTMYAMIQNNLGSAYGDLAQYQDSAENLQKSIAAYEVALQYRSANSEPARYAATQNNLGTSCWNLAQYQQPTVWLKRAIAAYQEALHYYTSESEPLSYAMLQNNLGTAYWNLAQHLEMKKQTAVGTSPTEVLLRQAIAAYQNALVYRTQQTVPASHAATQNNLGTAYWDLAMLPGTSTVDRRKYYEQAISAYCAAISSVEALTEQDSHRPALTFDLAATHNHLGLAYYHLAMDYSSPMTAADQQHTLEMALKHHLHALQGWETTTELQQSGLEFVVQIMRALFNQCGIQAQSRALAQIPPTFLPQVMSKL